MGGGSRRCARDRSRAARRGASRRFLLAAVRRATRTRSRFGRAQRAGRTAIRGERRRAAGAAARRARARRVERSGDRALLVQRRRRGVAALGDRPAAGRPPRSDGARCHVVDGDDSAARGAARGQRLLRARGPRLARVLDGRALAVHRARRRLARGAPADLWGQGAHAGAGLRLRTAAAAAGRADRDRGRGLRDGVRRRWQHWLDRRWWCASRGSAKCWRRAWARGVRSRRHRLGRYPVTQFRRDVSGRLCAVH